jgi:hypothetical protein
MSASTWAGRCALCVFRTEMYPTGEQVERAMVAHYVEAHPEKEASVRAATVRGPGPPIWRWEDEP